MSQQPQLNPDEVAAAQQRLAANQARLAELRRQQQQQSGQAPAAPPSAAAGGHPPPTYGYEDDEDDDDDFDEDDMEEEPESDNEFNDMIAEQSNASAACNPLPVHFDDEAVLTACKYGDLGTLKHFQSSGTLKADSIRDNRGRSALHYAVDSGAVDLCEHLLTLGLSPTLADESGITPRDIASILQLPLVSAVLGGDGREASSLSLAPPRLVMSKPAPKQSSHAVRSTWGLAAAAPAGAVFALSELGDNSVTTPAVANNCIAWNPLVDGSNASDYGTLDGHARSHVLTVANQEGTILGTADFLPLGRLCIKGTTRPEPFYTVASVRAMKGALSALIRSAGVTMDKCDVAFVSSKNLTPTLRPACYFRWFTRVLHPLRIFAAGAEAINEVFPSYKTYLDTAKADLVRKHAWYAPTTPRTWRMAVPDDLAGLAIVSRATSFDISVEITEVALRHFAEQSSHLGLFVTGEEGAPEAGFLLQSRTSAHGQYQIGLVFAVLGKVSAAEICDAVAVIAPHIEAVLCTNVCGLTEDDLRASKFAELEGAGQYLYLANSLKGTFCFDVKPSRVRVPITP